MLSIIIALLLGLSYRQQSVAGATQPDLLAAALVLVATSVIARAFTVRAARLTLANGETSPGRLLRVLSIHRMLVVASYGIIVYVCDWPAIVDTLGIGSWVLVDELVIFLPFVALLLDSFLTAWSGEHALDLHDFSRWDYVLFQSRQFLLPVTPILFFLLYSDLITVGTAAGIEWVASIQIATESYAFVSWLVFGALLFALYCGMPFVMRWLWRLESMPAGPLRERLEEFSEREGFRARDLLVWPTGENILNAAVVGPAAPFRYVMMTDALISELEPDEVEAVFAHEVGHAKHQHLLKFFFFIIGYSLLLYIILEMFGEQLAPYLTSAVAVLAFFVAGVVLWFGLLMGFVSRRFEQQADVYGAQSIGRVRGNDGEEGDDHPFVRALTRIGMQMGDIRENKGWRHFSLGSRIEFVRRFLADGAERRRYRQRIAGLMLFFFTLLGAIGVVAATTIPSQISKGRYQSAKAWATWLEGQGRTEEANRQAARALELMIDAGLVVPAATLDPTERHPDLWKDMNRRYDTATGVDVPLAERLVAMRDLAIGYLLLDMPSASRATIDDVFILTGGLPLPPMYEAQMLELMGLALVAEERPKGARLAFTDALALIPAEAPGGEELSARIRASLERLDPPRNR